MPHCILSCGCIGRVWLPIKAMTGIELNLLSLLLECSALLGWAEVKDQGLRMLKELFYLSKHFWVIESGSSGQRFSNSSNAALHHKMKLGAQVHLHMHKQRMLTTWQMLVPLEHQEIDMDAGGSPLRMRMLSAARTTTTDSLRPAPFVRHTLGIQREGIGSSLRAGCEGSKASLRGCHAQAGQPVISAVLPVADAPPLILHIRLR